MKKAESLIMTRRQRWLRLLKRIVRSAVLMYALIGLGAYVFQERLIFPGSFYQGSPDTQVDAGRGAALVRLKAADGTDLMGYFGSAEDKRGLPVNEERPTILYFYGNGESMSSAVLSGNMFRRMGYHCMLVDYPGYGMSSGSPSEQGCYQAAEAAYQHVLARPEVDRTKLVAAGWSLGGAVAIDLARRHKSENTFCALMTFSSFSSMVDLAKGMYPFLPVSMFLKHRFLSEEKIRELTIPYFNGHGRQDPGIPCAHADKLAAAYAGGPAGLTRFMCEGGHNDFFDAGGKDLETAIAAFLERVTDSEK